MGCDIHMYMEYKVGKSEWKAIDRHVKIAQYECLDCDACKAGRPDLCEDAYIHYNQLDCDRDYRVFGLLAGVRGPGERSPRGIPRDVSEIIREACEEYGVDGHSHSYLYLPELKRDLAIPGWNAPSYRELLALGENIEAEKTAESFLLGDKDPCKVRLVFWFDN